MADTSPVTRAQLAVGIVAGIGAGMMFGADFLAGQVLKDFTALEFYVGRAFAFGCASFFFLRPALRAFLSFSVRDRLLCVALNAAGFWLYSLLQFWSVKHGNAVVTTIVIGTMPATIALFSKKLSDLGGLFLLGLGVILAGLVVLNAADIGGLFNDSFKVFILPFICLALWTWYAVANARFLQRQKQLSRTDMVSIMGIMSMAIMCAAGALLVDIPRILHHPQLGTYALWAVILGVGSSWIGFWLWNLCARYCPPSVSGPLLVSETMFGLLYTFLWQQRLPKMTEGVAILLFAIGALMVVYAELRADEKVNAP